MSTENQDQQPWWSISDPEARAAAKKAAEAADVAEVVGDLVAGARRHHKRRADALRVPHDHWTRIGNALETENVRHYAHIHSGELAYAGSSNFLHRYRPNNESGRLKALLHALTEWGRWPFQVDVWRPMPRLGVATLTHRASRRSSAVYFFTLASLRAALADLRNLSEPQP